MNIANTKIEKHPAVNLQFIAFFFFLLPDVKQLQKKVEKVNETCKCKKPFIVLDVKRIVCQL